MKGKKSCDALMATIAATARTMSQMSEADVSKIHGTGWFGPGIFDKQEGSLAFGLNIGPHNDIGYSISCNSEYKNGSCQSVHVVRHLRTAKAKALRLKKEFDMSDWRRLLPVQIARDASKLHGCKKLSKYTPLEGAHSRPRRSR